MLKIKSIIAMLLCAVMCISLIACGDEKKNDGGENKTDNVSSKLEVPEELVGTTVKYATWIDEYEVESGPVITNFINETGINVELVNVPQHTYVQKLAAMITAGQAPDVFRETCEWPRLLQLAQPIENAGIDVTDPLWDQSIVKFGTVGGKAFLVNTVGSIWCERNIVCYNKKIFNDNALTSPADYMEADNWTWDTFYKCLKDVKDCGVKYGGLIEVDYLANSVGASLIKYENGVFSNGTSDPLLLEAYTFSARTEKEGLVNIGLTQSDFVNGDCGLYITGSYACKASGHFNAMDPDDIGYAMMPKYNKEQSDYTYSSYPLAWGILEGAENPKGAGLFLEYFLNVENYKKAGSYDTAFKNEEAKKFYEKVTSNGFTEGAGYVYVTHGSAKLINENGRYYIRSGLQNVDPLQVATNLKSASNKVDAAVKSANEVIAKTAEKYK